jgi:hypothetical protein
MWFKTNGKIIFFIIILKKNNNINLKKKTFLIFKIRDLGIEDLHQKENKLRSKLI